MYTIVMRFQILDPGRVPSAEVVVESIRRACHPAGRVEHARAERQWRHVVAIAFVTAGGPAQALDLGRRTARTVESSTASLCLASVRMLHRPMEPG